jgi:hypothetical protein
MGNKIETRDELKDAVRAAALSCEFDVRIEAPALRNAWNVADTISDAEIRRTVTETLRSDDNPEVVFVLEGGMVVGQMYVPVTGDYSIGDELWRVERDLSAFDGGRVWLTPAPADARGLGILSVYRMPPGDYRPQDWPLVARFGIEGGKYQQSISSDFAVPCRLHHQYAEPVRHGAGDRSVGRRHDRRRRERRD